ncbi:hypothetical protein ACG915_19030 [Acinetobacter geminorum]
MSQKDTAAITLSLLFELSRRLSACAILSPIGDGKGATHVATATPEQ